jgi:hypothetical protein
MKLLLLVLIAALAVAYFLPGKQEGTDTPCTALTVRAQRLIDEEVARLPASSDPKVQSSIAAARAQASTDVLLQTLIRARMPFLPPEPACAVAYWASVWQPDLRQLAPVLLPRF